MPICWFAEDLVHLCLLSGLIHRNRNNCSRSVTDSFHISVTVHENVDRNVTAFLTLLWKIWSRSNESPCHSKNDASHFGYNCHSSLTVFLLLRTCHSEFIFHDSVSITFLWQYQRYISVTVFMLNVLWQYSNGTASIIIFCELSVTNFDIPGTVIRVFLLFYLLLWHSPDSNYTCDSSVTVYLPTTNLSQ